MRQVYGYLAVDCLTDSRVRYVAQDWLDVLNRARGGGVSVEAGVARFFERWPGWAPGESQVQPGGETGG